MDESLIKLGLRSQTVLGGIQLVLVAIFGFTLIAFLQTTYNRDLFTCEPETNSITKQLCYDEYSFAMNQWFTPLHFVVFACAVLVVLSISFIIYGAFTLQQIRPQNWTNQGKKVVTFKRAYLLHVCCRLIFIAGIVGIFCGNQTFIVPKTYTCSMAAVSTPIPLNQTETDLHCHDQHYREKSISNIAIIVIKGFILILCAIEFIQVKRLTPSELLKKLLGEIFDPDNNNLPEEPDANLSWNIPRQAANYIERSQVENEIMAKLRSTDTSMIVIVALPGMGKTQVAIRVSHLLAREKRRVIFVQKQETLLDICREILYVLYGDDGMTGNDDDIIVRQAKRKLSELQEDTVVVLDNTEEIQEQRDFAFESFAQALLVSAPKVKLMITTRRNINLDFAGIHTVHLEAMDPQSSANLLKDGFEAHEEYLEEICMACLGVPLILINCLSLLKKGFEPKVLVEQLRNNPIDHLEDNSDVRRLLGKFLHNSQGDLKKNLVLLSVFPSTFSDTDMEILFESGAKVQTVKTKMVEDSLLQRTPDEEYSIHPLVKAFCRKEGSSLDMGDKAKKKFNHHYLKQIILLSKQFTTKDKACEAISTFRKEKANITEAFNNCFEDTVREEKLFAIDVANSTEVLDFLNKVFSPRKACTQLYEKCEEISRDCHDKKRLADSLNSLGFRNLYSCGAAHLKADEKTLAIFKEAYDICKTLPEEKRKCPTHAHTVSKLGLCYALQGKPENGRRLIREGIEMRKELGVLPLYVAAGNCDLGHSYRHDNDQMAINTWEKETLPVYKKELSDHPWTATLLHAIGDAYKDLANEKSGDYASKAEGKFREALEIQTKLLKNHLDTARSHACLSDTLWLQGKLKLALGERKKALEIRERVLGPDHEKTITTRANIEELQQKLYEESGRKISAFSSRYADIEKGVTNKAHSELSLTSFKAIE